jgi:hypothetical protein
MKNCNGEYLKEKGVLPAARRSALKQEALNLVLMRSSQAGNNPIFDFIRQLDRNGARFSTINGAGNGEEGVLLTVSPVDWVVNKLQVFCRERLLRCNVESRGPRLSVAIVGDQNCQRIGELHLFTSQYGDFAGIRFPI